MVTVLFNIGFSKLNESKSIFGNYSYNTQTFSGLPQYLGYDKLVVLYHTQHSRPAEYLIIVIALI